MLPKLAISMVVTLAAVFCLAKPAVQGDSISSSDSSASTSPFTDRFSHAEEGLAPDENHSHPNVAKDRPPHEHGSFSFIFYKMERQTNQRYSQACD